MSIKLIALLGLLLTLAGAYTFLEYFHCNYKCRGVTNELAVHVADEKAAQAETARVQSEWSLRTVRHGELALQEQQKAARTFAALSARAAAAGAGRSCGITTDSFRLRLDAANEANAARTPEGDHGRGTGVPDPAPAEGSQASILVIGEDDQNDFIVDAATAYAFKYRQWKELVKTYNDLRNANGQ